MATIFTWFLTSKLGRALLILFIIGLLISAAVAAYTAWRQGIYDEGYKQGKADAEAMCEAARKSYFDGAQALATEIRQASEDAATALKSASAQSSAQVDGVVKQALQRWTKNPVLVYSEKEGKCTVSPDLGKSWSEINREANK